MSADEIFICSEKQLHEIRIQDGKSVDKVMELVQELKTWRDFQPHLPEDEDDRHLEKILRLNKYNLEKSKMKLDMYYTVRNQIPEFYEDREPLNLPMQTVMDTVMFVPLPKLTKEYSRVYVARIVDSDPSKFDFDQIFKFIFAIGDLRIHHDNCSRDIYIMDYSGVNWRHIVKFNPFVVRKAFHVIETVFADRIQGIHFLNTPSYANVIIVLAKALLKAKLSERVVVHKTMDTLQDYISEDILPLEYNGKEKSLTELYGNWRRFIEQNNSWLIQESRKKSNEGLRPKNEEVSYFFGLFTRQS